MSDPSAQPSGNPKDPAFREHVIQRMIRESVTPEAIAQEYGVDVKQVRRWKDAFLKQLKTATKGQAKKGKGRKSSAAMVEDISRQRIRPDDAKRQVNPLVPFPSQPGAVPMNEKEKKNLEQTQRLILEQGNVSDVARKLGMMPKNLYEKPENPISHVEETGVPTRATTDISGQEKERFSKNWAKMGEDGPPPVEIPPPVRLNPHERFFTRVQGWPLVAWFLRGGRFDSIWVLLVFGAIVLGFGYWVVKDAAKYNTDPTQAAISAETPRYLQPISRGEVILAETLIKKFFSIRNVNEFEPLIRSPQTVMPMLRRYYVLNQLKATEVSNFGGHTRANHPGMDVTHHDVALGLLGKARQIAIVHGEAGPKIDWEIAVAYQSMPWRAFRMARPTKPAYFRLSLQPSSYYSMPFGSEEIFRSFRLTYPGEIRVINGFVLIDSEAELKLREVFPLHEVLPDGDPVDEDAVVDVIVGIQYPHSNIKEDLVEITSVLSTSWLLPYKSGERHFDMPEPLPAKAPTPDAEEKPEPEAATIEGEGGEDEKKEEAEAPPAEE